MWEESSVCTIQTIQKYYIARNESNSHGDCKVSAPPALSLTLLSLKKRKSRYLQRIWCNLFSKGNSFLSFFSIFLRPAFHIISWGNVELFARRFSAKFNFVCTIPLSLSFLQRFLSTALCSCITQMEWLRERLWNWIYSPPVVLMLYPSKFCSNETLT